MNAGALRSALLSVLFAVRVVSTAPAAAAPNSAPAAGLSFWTCGDHQLEHFQLTWTEDRPSLRSLQHLDLRALPGFATAAARDSFKAGDEVKSVRWRERPALLITSSFTGGVALIDPTASRILWHTPLPNAHSAAVLPGGWIVAAGSTGSDRLTAYQPQPDSKTSPELATCPLPHAHGVVWDEARRCLWAAGGETILRLPLPVAGQSWAPTATLPLREGGAHDLVATPDGRSLILTTTNHVWSLDCATLATTPFAPLKDRANVKSVQIAGDGMLLVVTANPGHWWSEALELIPVAGAAHRLRLDGRRLYKARLAAPLQR